MEHILKETKIELERTHRLAETYKEQYLITKFLALFPGNFKEIFRKFARKKEELLEHYLKVYHDIDANKADPLKFEEVESDFMSLIDKATEASKYLTKLVAHSPLQENILLHEKIFFAEFLKHINADIIRWVQFHEKKAFGDIQETSIEVGANPITSALNILKEKKSYLENHSS